MSEPATITESPPLATPAMIDYLAAAGLKPAADAYPFAVFERLEPARRYVLISSRRRTIDGRFHPVDVDVMDGSGGVRTAEPICRNTPLRDAIALFLGHEAKHPPMEVRS